MTLPEPEGGLVLSYSYLWRSEHEAGQTEGGKNRPCVIVLVIHREMDTKIVTVARITHYPPADPTLAMEIPHAIKRHLGMDDDRSWIMLDDFNEFIWPGHDLRIVPRKPGHYDYGFLPPNFYAKLMHRIFELYGEGRIFTVSYRD
jgi:hypothetical protein